MKFRRFLFSLLILIFIGIFVFSGYQVASYLLNSKEQSDLYNDLASIVENAQKEASSSQPGKNTSDEASSSDPDDPSAPTELTILPEYRALYDMNSDMVG